MLDLETTGLSSEKHEVSQISVIRCSDKHQLNKYIKIEHPETVSMEALQVTGRTMQDLLKGEDKELVVKFVESFFSQDGANAESRCIVGHNVHRFDQRFCHALWNKVGRDFPAHLWLDTIPFTKAFAVKKGISSNSFNLQASMDVVGIQTKGQMHNALNDTRNNYKLWMKLMESGIDHLPHIKRIPHIVEK